ncbi:MAG: FtsX-like permease family protein [Anaerovoracaceae bacterium]
MSRFLSIVSIVALGAGFLAGLTATAPDMINSANSYFNRLNTYDFLVRGTMGLTREDAKEVKDIDGIKDVGLIYQYDSMFKDTNDENLTTRVMELDFSDGEVKNDINKLKLIEGRMPKKQNECVVEVPNMYAYKGKIGLKYHDKEKDKTFTTVGIVKSSLYISELADVTDIGSGKITLGMYIKPQKDRKIYTAMYATMEKPEDNNCYTKEYKRETSKIVSEIKLVGNKRSEIRTDKIKNTQMEKLKKQSAKFHKSKRETIRKLADSKLELDKNKANIEEASKSIAAAKNQLKIQTLNINKKENQLDEIKPQIDKIKSLINSGTPISDEMKMQVKAYDSGRTQIAKAKKVIKVNERKLALQSQIVNQNKEKLGEGFKTYEINRVKAQKEFSKAEKKIEEGKEKIKEIKNAKWIVNDRLDNLCISAFEDDVDKVRAISKLFPIFFFLVAALVALTTMTRMVEEERGQIGVLKSLGYSNRSIKNYYLAYGLIATIIGCIIGLSIGFVVFPKVISNAYGMMYTLPPTKVEFIWQIAVIVSVLITICILGTTHIACQHELKEKPAVLLLPKAPVAGKRILLERLTPIWSRLKFTRKVTLRNLFRYKKRFLMTIIGVAGCFALLVTGFGVKDSISDIVKLQYDSIYKYDFFVLLKNDEFKPSDKYIANYSIAQEKSAEIKTDQGEEDISIFVPEDTRTLEKYVDLRERKTGAELTITDDSVIVTEKVCESLGIKIGDKVELDLNGQAKNLVVSGISENYVSSYIYMSPNMYKNVFKVSPKYNIMLAKGNFKEKNSNEDISTYLLKQKDVNYVMASENIKNTFEDSVKNINYIVLVLILAAGGLAVIVLYNLTNVNICERKKELATIKVLGFYEKEVDSYVFREINLLSYIGIVFGIPVGIALHQFVIKTAEVGGIMFGRTIEPLSFVYSAIITVGFTLLVNVIMKKRIKSIDMVESMKANE